MNIHNDKRENKENMEEINDDSSLNFNKERQYNIEVLKLLKDSIEFSEEEEFAFYEKLFKNDSISDDELIDLIKKI